MVISNSLLYVWGITYLPKRWHHVWQRIFDSFIIDDNFSCSTLERFMQSKTFEILLRTIFFYDYDSIIYLSYSTNYKEIESIKSLFDDDYTDSYFVFDADDTQGPYSLIVKIYEIHK